MRVIKNSRPVQLHTQIVDRVVPVQRREQPQISLCEMRADQERAVVLRQARLQ